ncbi:Histidine kinase [Flavobacterium swingsii]|uniref:histidine kinase n=1 Tax=Flavobacterium swingsii TaxID=498292 RepID=A0A1I0XJG6_9FLAO|nr:Histidine kinase [Flavobacterium swingsii]
MILFTNHRLSSLKKIIFIILFHCLFLSCNQKEKSQALELNDNNIDTLLSRSYNFKLDKKQRDKYANQVLLVLSNKTNDSTTRHYYFKLAGRHYNLNESEKYLNTCREVYALSQESKDSLGMAKALQYIGDYHYNKFTNDSAYYYYSKAEKTYLHLKNNENIDRLKLYKANILFYEKDFSGCETAVINILKTIKNKKDIRLLYDCYITLGNALEGSNNTKQALIYYNKADEITNQLKNDLQYLSLKAQTYNYLGKVFQKENKHQKAIYHFEKALGFSNFRNKEPLLYANLVNNLGYSKFKLQDKSALSYLNKALQIRDSLNNIPGIVSSKINLSEYYFNENDTPKALIFSTEAKKLAHDNKIFEDELKSLELLAKIDIKNVSFYNNRFMKLTDSLQNNERKTRDKFARIEFETDEILNQKKNIEVEKEKISSQRWIILGFSLFFILVIALLYFAKLQHAKNKELQFEQEQRKANEEIYQLMLDQQSKIDEGRQTEKKRIAQELHDGIMSKLTSTRLNLFILSKKTDEETIKKCLLHIANIQNIEKEIRAISHDLNKDIFDGKDSFKTIITALFDDLKTISETNSHIEIDDDINWETIETSTKMHLYRIFQETLQNIRKYAKANIVTANISKDENHIYIEINDNGIGFNVKKTKSGIGLKNIQSRTTMINGTLNIKSNVGKGTQINLIIPT